MALTKISTDGVKDDAVTAGKIPANAVGSSELADNAVNTAAIADDAVTTVKIADNSVTAAKLADVGAIDNTNQLGTNVVTTVKIADDAVTTAKIANEAVTLAKLPHGDSNNNGKFLRANNGADPTFETVTGTTINNNVDNRVITGSGTANTLNGESGLIWDGTKLQLDKSINAYMQPAINIYNSYNGGWGGLIRFSAKYSGNEEVQARIRTYGGSHANDASLAFETGAPTEIIRMLPTGGITFNGDTATANALDDYEEGTFTATITGIGGGTNPTFAAQTSSAAYIRVGRIVHCHVYIFDINCTNSGTGIVTTIAGFPFASSGHYYPGVVTHNTIIGNGNVNTGYLQANSNSPHFIPLIDGTTGGNNANTGNPKYIMVSVSYTAQ